MDVTKLSVINDVLQRYGINIRKSWGQNFLLNKSIVETIVAAANLTGQQAVLEIGPGLGVMTSELLERAGKVVAIEVDPRMCEFLRHRFGSEQDFTLVEGDFLEQDLGSMVDEYMVVANLPYYITSPILLKLIAEQRPPQAAVLLVQLEVARRLSAKPGTKDYSSLTVIVQYNCQVDVVCTVSAGNFYPRPKVDSAVIKLHWRPPSRLPRNEDLMFRIVRIAFSQRRKMLRGLLAGQLGIDAEKIARALQQMGYSEKVRGEKLKVEDFAALSDLLEVYL